MFCDTYFVWQLSKQQRLGRSHSAQFKFKPFKTSALVKCYLMLEYTPYWHIGNTVL